MPVQDYNINTKDKVVGQLYGMMYDNTVTTGLLGTTNVGNAAWGTAVIRGAVDGEVLVGGEAQVHGVIVRQQNKEAATRPSDGTVAFAAGDTVGILREGFIQVLANEAVTAGAAAHIEADTGLWFAAGKTLTTNCVYETSAAAGEVAVVRITSK